MSKLIVGQRIFCLACCQGEVAEVRLSKVGKPFISCPLCSSKFFLGAGGWVGPTRLWGRLSMAMKTSQDDAALAGVAGELMAREGQRVQAAGIAQGMAYTPAVAGR